jgi:hypothetical protein
MRRRLPGDPPLHPAPGGMMMRGNAAASMGMPAFCRAAGKAAPLKNSDVESMEHRRTENSGVQLLKERHNQTKSRPITTSNHAQS